MEIAELKVKSREEKGKSASRRLRAAGFVPAVLYGEKLETASLAISLKDFANLLKTEAGTNIIVKLEIEGQSKSQTAIIKEIQKHSTKDYYLHVDFLKIAMDEAIEAQVPVTVVGDSPGVKEGGVLQHGLWEIQVKALPKDLPDHFEVDISKLAIGEAVRVADLPLLEGVEVLTGDEETVVSVVPPTELKEEELVTEEAEPELVGEKREEEEKEAEKEEVKEETPKEPLGSAQGREKGEKEEKE